MRAVITAKCYPNLQAVVCNTFPLDLTAKHHWTLYAKNCIKPGIDYIHQRLGDEVNPVKAFKAARLFSPLKTNDMQPSIPSK